MLVNKNGVEGERIYVFSIGIDTYKSDAIKNLAGCVNDVLKLKQFLQSKLHIPEANYLTLTNREATREGIIANFRIHFKNLREGDVAVFHYSGHGSWEKASKEFSEARIEPPGGRNEVLVCYDSGDPDIYNIADKEIRMLISEVQYPNNGSPQNIHFVGLFDCCHSGSMMRSNEEGYNVRLAPPSKQPRPLEAYLEGQFTKSLSKLGALRIPPVDYVSLAACSPRQSAIEGPDGGLFTSALIKALSSVAKGSHLPNYAELFHLVRELTKNNSFNRQTPYLEFAGKANPYDCFLLFGEVRENIYPELFLKDGEWCVGLGAIHGITVDSVAEQIIPVFTHNGQQAPSGCVRIKSVGVEFTKMRDLQLFPRARSLDLTEEDNPLTQKVGQTYLVGLAGNALPVSLTINDNMRGLQEQILNEVAKAKYRGRFLWVGQAGYELKTGNNQLVILRHQFHGNELICGVHQTDRVAIQHILTQLSTIARWEQLSAIETPKRASIDPDEVVLSFEYEDYNGRRHLFEFDAMAAKRGEPLRVTLEFDPEEGGLPYKFEVENRTIHKLYFYLIHFGSKFEIKQKHESFLKGVNPASKIVLYDSIQFNLGLGIHEQGVQETLNSFMLIASREKLIIPHIFQQEGMGKSFGKIVSSVEEWNRQKSEYRGSHDDEIPLKYSRADWAAKRVEVRIIRKKN